MPGTAIRLELFAPTTVTESHAYDLAQEAAADIRRRTMLDTQVEVKTATVVSVEPAAVPAEFADAFGFANATPGTACAAGDAAGAVAVTGILATSTLLSVWQVTNIATDAGPPITTDLTAEFTVTADDEIDNTGGTDTTGDVLVVTWVD